MSTKTDGASKESRTITRLFAVSIAGAFTVGLAACGGGSTEPPPPPPGAIPFGQSIGSAAIAGRVVFHGDPPKRRAIKMFGEAACRPKGEGAFSEEVVVNPDGTLRYVFVHVVAGLGDRVFAPPSEPAVMDQVGCLFVPHLLAAQAGQAITFTSSDPVVHNVRAVADANPVFNISMSGRGRTVKRFFPHPEVVGIRCDIHVWMSARIAVDATPFHAVTGDGGTFALDGLPAGTFEVEAWHETLGATRETVTLADGERRELEFVFAAAEGK